MRHYIIIIFIFLIINQLYSQNNEYLKAKIAFEQQQYSKAQKFADDYCNNQKNDKRAILLNAKIHIKLKQYEEALNKLSQLKDNFSEDVLLLKSRSNAALSNNDLAAQQLDKYLSLRNKEFELQLQSYPEFSQLKTTDKWKEIWQNDRYSRKEKFLENIFYAFKTKKYSEANERIDNFLKRYKNNAYAHYLKASLLYKQKRYNEALKQVEIAVDNKNEVVDYKQLKAQCLTELNRNKKAVSLFSEIISADSLNLVAYLGRAEAYMKINKIAEADADISKYRAYYPDDTKAQFLNAQINEKGGDYLSAISKYGKLIKSSPDRADYFIKRADAYVKTKTYKYALNDYAMALDLEPKNIYVYKQKALIYKLMGNNKKACIEWQYAAKMGDIQSMDKLKKHCRK